MTINNPLNKAIIFTVIVAAAAAAILAVNAAPFIANFIRGGWG